MVSFRIPLPARGTDLAATSYGPDGGPLVLCIPGISATRRTFERVAGAWAGRGLRVVALDLRGRGESPPGRLYTAGWDAHAEDVAHAMEVLGARRAQLVGHSMGAYVAMAAAGRWPHRVAAVALLDALGVPEAAAAAAVRPALATLGVVYPSEAEYLRAVRATGLFEPWSAPWEAHFRADLVPTAGGVGRRTSAGAVEADRAFLEAHDPRALWPRVRCPGLVVRCTAPLAGPLGEGLFIPESEARAFCAVAPSAEVLAVPSHHYSVLDDPAAELGVGRFLS